MVLNSGYDRFEKRAFSKLDGLDGFDRIVCVYVDDFLVTAAHPHKSACFLDGYLRVFPYTQSN